MAYLDDDAVAAPDWLSLLVEPFQRDATVGAVGGRVEPAYGAPPPGWLTPSLAHMLSVVDWPGPARDISANEWIVGANIAFRRSYLEQVGGFREDLNRIGLGLISMDEVAVYQAMADRGYRVMYEPAAMVQHEIPRARLRRRWMLERSWAQGQSAAILARTGPQGELRGRFSSLRQDTARVLSAVRAGRLTTTPPFELACRVAEKVAFASTILRT